MQKNFDNFSMQEALRLAKTPAGQQLLALLRQQDSAQLRQAMTQAASGNYESVQQSLAEILSSAETKALLQQLRGDHNG